MPHFLIAQKFDRGRKRPQQVSASLGGNTPRTVNIPLASIDATGLVADGKISHTEAGHLVPLELGGPDISNNLVPMYGGVNRGTYRQLERDIREACIGKRKPVMLVRCTYSPDPADDARIPTEMAVHLAFDAEPQTTVPTTANLFRRIANTRVAPARLDISGAEDIELRRALVQIKADFASSGFLVETHFGITAAGQLPPVGQRPNAWIDWLVYEPRHLKVARLALSKLPPGEFTVGSRHGFTLQQRLFVQLLNRFTQPDHRKGECWSDAGADPIQSALTELGTDDGIHVDHIVPEASGGWNLYSNAGVVSSLYNKQKGR